MIHGWLLAMALTLGQSAAAPAPGEVSATGDSVAAPDTSAWDDSAVLPKAPYGREHELQAVFDEGFAIRSWDREFELKFHVLGQFDLKVFDPPGQYPAARTGAYIPRARIYFEGHLTEPVQYELSLQRSLDGQFDLLDANFNLRLSDERLQLKIGRQLVPYSFAWYDHLEQYFVVPERALFPLNFGLSRATGASLWGLLGDGMLQYAVAGVDGRLAGLADNNTTADGVGYLNLRPLLHTERFSALRFLNIGGSLAIGTTYQSADQLPLRTSAQASENDESAISASAVFLDWNDGVTSRGPRTQGALHVACYSGPLSVECEWQVGRHRAFNEHTGMSTEINSSGFHGGFGYFVTGETIESRTTVRPLRPLDPRHHGSGIGAWELFARYADLRLGNEVFTDGLVDPNLWTNQAYTIDLGFNWYWNQFIKWTFDWQHAGYHSPVLVNENTDQFSRTNDLFWFRGQVYF